MEKKNTGLDGTFIAYPNEFLNIVDKIITTNEPAAFTDCCEGNQQFKVYPIAQVPLQ